MKITLPSLSVVSALVLSLSISSATAMTFTVTNAANAGKGTLRDAINTVLTATPPNRITFNLPTPYTISLTSALSNLTSSVTIDGSTQPGYFGDPIVKLASVGQTNALTLGAPNCLVRGLIITGFVGNAISIGFGGSNRIENCHILRNGTGIWISGSGANIIGGTADSNRNVISGNENGIYLYGTSAGGNSVLGNYVGVDPTDLTKALGNSYGIIISDSSSNLIAGIASGPQTISGNRSFGVHITGANARRNVLVKNHIGTDSGGILCVSNPVGVLVQAPMNIIGGTNVSDRNVISANWSKGVHLMGANAWSNSILGNYIGVSYAGDATVGNQDDGIYIDNAPNNSIGGNAAGAGNVISGNRINGVYLMGESAVGNVFQGNLIGCDASASRSVSNGYDGVVVLAPLNVIGEGNIISGNRRFGVTIGMTYGTVIKGNYIGINSSKAIISNVWHGVYVSGNGNTIGPGNLIAGNDHSGVYIYGCGSNRVVGNLIGTDGTRCISNRINGVDVRLSTNITIGGTGVGEANTISGNERNQIYFEQGVSNRVEGNFIGLAANGYHFITNSPVADGIAADGAVGLMIGGASAFARNVISGLKGDAINMQSASGGCILGNYVGLNRDGNAVVTNSGAGLNIVNCTNLTVGQANARNVFGGNESYQIYLHGGCSNQITANYFGFLADGLTRAGDGGWGLYIGSTHGNRVSENVIISRQVGITTVLNADHNTFVGNLIGFNAAGSPAYTGMTWGISMNASSSNVIGGTLPSDRNIIRGAVNDISISSTNSIGNVIQGNFIGVRADGVTPSGSSTLGVELWDAQKTMVGGTEPGEGNVIAYHSGDGVKIWGLAWSNSVLGNSIYSNRVGITIIPPANGAMPAPVLTNVISYAGSSRIQGYLSGVVSKTCRLEFFFNDQTNGAGGKVFVGTTNVVTDGSGMGQFAIVLPSFGSGIVNASATATDPGGNTSSFSSPPSSVSLGFDTDNDKMPDFWELQYGLNPNVSNPPTADADSDHVYDYQEYVAGTLPNNVDSCLEFYGLKQTGSRYELAFPTVIGRTYAVDWITPPNPPLTGIWTWPAASNGIAGTGENLAIQVTNNAPNFLWYRLRTQIP
jgi:hypothetical protein